MWAGLLRGVEGIRDRLIFAFFWRARDFTMEFFKGGTGGAFFFWGAVGCDVAVNCGTRVIRLVRSLMEGWSREWCFDDGDIKVGDGFSGILSGPSFLIFDVKLLHTNIEFS